MSGMGELERCLQEKAGLLRGMLAETKNIGGLLALRDMEGLNGAVAARRDCIGKIDALDVRIKACGAAESEAQNRLLKNIHKLLGEILEADSANMKAAGDISAALMSGIKEVNKERNLLKYRPVMNTASRFVDREG